jgi:nucleoside-diphosphate-sugar epimerase
MILVTGGAGFIGSHTAKILLNEGEHVRILDNLSSGNLSNLDGVELEFIEGDIRDVDLLVEAATDCDAIIHLAAKVSVPGSVADPLGFEEVNGRGFLSVLEAARKARVPRVVYASSSAVYGSNPELPKHEDQELQPESPDASAKASNELYGAVYSTTMGVSCVGLRYFNVFGPKQDPNGPYAAVIPRFVQQSLAGKPLTIFGDGEQGRDFVSVRDVARANSLACRVDGVGGRVFNIGGGQMRTVNELAALVLGVVNGGGGIQYLGEREGDVRYSVASIERAVSDLGWRPTEDFSEALQETIVWYQQLFEL